MRSVDQEIWRYSILRNAQTSKEEKMLMMHWEPGFLNSERMQDLLLKLDSLALMDVQDVAHGPDYKSTLGVVWRPTSNNFVESQPEVQTSNNVAAAIDPSC